MRRRSKLLLLALALLTGATDGSAQQSRPLMTLKELRDIGVAGKSISATGVVTCVEKHHFFMQDETGAMQVQVWNAQQVVSAGDLVAVSGVLVGYGGGMMIRGVDVSRQGTRPLPEPETPKAKELVTGGARCQRVRLTGAVHDIALVRDEVRLMVRLDGVPLSVCWHLPEDQSIRPDDLLDAVVEVTGVAHSGAGRDGSTTGGRIPLASRDDLRVIKPGGADVLQRPLLTMARLRTDVTPHQERFRMIGTVTFASVAGWFYFQDGTGTARAGRSQVIDAAPDQRRPLLPSPGVKPGDVVELIGYVFQDRPGKVMPWLVQCEWRILRHEAPPPWEPMTSAAILAGDFDGRPVSVTGEVVEAKIEKDRDGFTNHTITINDGDVSFWALLQKQSPETVPVKIGDYVRLDGVVMAFHSQEGGTERFRINLNELSDIHPAARPWRVQHFMRWLLAGLGVILVAVVWIVVLRLQVRRQTARLRESGLELERFKAVTETSTDFIAMATLDNSPLYMNPAGRRMLGIPLDADLTSIPFESVSTPEGRELMRAGMPRALEHGHWECELNMRHLDGHEVPVSFLGLVVRSADGQPQYIASIARDISARKRMEEQLRESNEELLRFKAVAESSTDLIAMSSLDQRPLYVNTAGRKLLGMPMDAEASTISFTDFYTKASMDLFEREGFAHALEHGHWNAEITMQHRDGREIPVSFVGLIIKSPDGRPQYMSCIARDISEHRLLEKQLRDSLEQERQINQLKSSFVNTISHEFRTPLGIILFAASMLRRFDARFGPAERAQQLDAIDDAVARMNDLVEQSLSLGRAETAKPQMSRFDPGELCRHIVDEVMSSTSHRSPITFTTDNGSHPGCSDEVMLRAILANLLGNAVKYSPAGTPVSLHLARENEAAIFTVRDHGPGLRAEDMPNLFTTFHRGSDTAGIPGSGLGLAIVKRCTEALGGSVAACNAHDGGAQFTVRLPIFASDCPESHSSSSS